jgi:hypothetical protein
VKCECVSCLWYVNVGTCVAFCVGSHVINIVLVLCVHVHSCSSIVHRCNSDSHVSNVATVITDKKPKVRILVFVEVYLNQNSRETGVLSRWNCAHASLPTHTHTTSARTCTPTCTHTHTHIYKAHGKRHYSPQPRMNN